MTTTEGEPIPKALDDTEFEALRASLRKFAEPLLKDGACGCCVARAMVLAAIDIAYASGSAPMVAQLLEFATNIVG